MADEYCGVQLLPPPPSPYSRPGYNLDARAHVCVWVCVTLSAGHLPLLQSGPYYCTHCPTYSTSAILAHALDMHAWQHNAGTTVRFLTYTVHLAVVRIARMSRVRGRGGRGSTNSPKPNLHNDSLGSRATLVNNISRLAAFKGFWDQVSRFTLLKFTKLWVTFLLSNRLAAGGNNMSTHFYSHRWD